MAEPEIYSLLMLRDFTVKEPQVACLPSLSCYLRIQGKFGKGKQKEKECG